MDQIWITLNLDPPQDPHAYHLSSSSLQLFLCFFWFPGLIVAPSLPSHLTPKHGPLVRVRQRDFAWSPPTLLCHVSPLHQEEGTVSPRHSETICYLLPAGPSGRYEPDDYQHQNQEIAHVEVRKAPISRRLQEISRRIRRFEKLAFSMAGIPAALQTAAAENSITSARNAALVQIGQ